MGINELRHKQTPFILCTIAVCIVLVCVTLVQHGMFMDGTQYAIVAKNLAEGKGSFWFPYLSSSWERHGNTAFLEHPPLVYWLQSFFFKLFHSSIYSERAYDLFVFILCAVLIKATWQRLFAENERYRLFWWLPVLSWVITPSVYWCFSNNMLESTVSVFVLGSAYAFIRALQAPTNKWAWLSLSAFAIVLASMSKGLQGLFPLVLPVVAALSYKEYSWRKMLAWTITLFGIVSLTFLVLILLNEEAKESLTFYVKERLIYRVTETSQVDNRFAVLGWLLTELLVPFILLLIFYLSPKVMRKELIPVHLHANERSWTIFFFLLGISGVLPLVFTYVQRAVYFVPALPFFAIALALLMLPYAARIIEHLNNSNVKSLKWIGMLALVGSLLFAFMRVGGVYRDTEVITEAHMLGEVLPENSVVGVPYSIYDDWDFQFYVLRYHHIVLDPDPGEYEYKMIENGKPMNDFMYELMEPRFKNYQLYKRISRQ